MVSSKESPVHDNWKNAIVNAKETDTVFLNRFHSPALRALRTERTTRLEKSPEVNAMTEFGTARELYFGGNMEAAIPLTGQVAGPHRFGATGRRDHRGDSRRVPQRGAEPVSPVPGLVGTRSTALEAQRHCRLGGLERAVVVHQTAIDERRAHARAETRNRQTASNRTSRKWASVYFGVLVRFDQHEVRPVAFAQEAALRDSKKPRGRMRHLLHDLRGRQPAFVHEFQRASSAYCTSGRPLGALRVRARLFLERVRRVVGGEHVDASRRSARSAPRGRWRP